MLRSRSETQPYHDIVLDAKTPGAHFTLTLFENRVEIIEGVVRVRINGSRCSSRQIVGSCDRLEWDGITAIFARSDLGLGNASPAAVSRGAPPTLRTLEALTNTLMTHSDAHAGFHKLLTTLMEVSGAEDGSLLSESSDGASWNLVASVGEDGEKSGARREIFSSTILSKALSERATVYIENIIGHPQAEAYSVIQGRIFSVACIPLMIAGKTFGAVLLHTRTPGKSIYADRLVEVGIIATQAALMLKSREADRTPLEKGARPSEKKAAFTYVDPPMAAAVRLIEKFAPAGVNILVTGETGTGKEVAAKELHRLSTKKDGPFIALNCAAIPAGLLESMLFGHEKGAFTGADRRQAGKFEAADGGTLFLDEIGDLSLELQTKLLRVVQQKTVEPLGSNRSIAVDVRIVAATHRNLAEMVQKKEFRQDLYYRLSTAIISLPALRMRKGDLKPLTELFLGNVAPEKTLSAEAWSSLQAHSWPGNVRELEHVLTREALLSDGAEIRADDLQIESASPGGNGNAEIFWDGAEDLSRAQDRFTQQLVQLALLKFGGSRPLTAKRLGISERTLYRILSESANSGGTA